MNKEIVVDELIKELLDKAKGYQMTEEEYRYIASFLGNVNFLVFGVGYDSELWRYSNQEGKTIFLEDDPEWIDDHDDIIKVKYTCRIWDYAKLLYEYERGIYDNLKMELPREVVNTKWDAIFVDGPSGYSPTCHGRMQSIFTARILANKETDVFIHDCNRKIEDLYSKKIFEIKKQLTKLRHCKISF